MKPLLLGRMRNNIYYVEENLTLGNANKHTQRGKLLSMNTSLSENKKSPPTTTCLQSRGSNNIEIAKLWHLRLGHIPFNRLHIVFPNLHCNKVDHDFLCIVCPLGKQAKKLFRRSSIKTTDIFQMLHIDLWGPMTFSNRLKCKIFCTIVDDFSRYTWVIFIKNKSEFLDIFKKFYLLVQTQFGKLIKIVKTNNAQELSKGDTWLY